jgi:hypothetical protein
MTRQRIQIAQLDQPICVNTFGVAPCTAEGTPCYNTRKTCQDTVNYDDEDSVLSFFWHTECENPLLLPGVFPTLTGVSTRPAVVNIASADPDKEPLGMRAEATVTLRDHPYHDRYVDPYFRQRGYNPLNRGTFWAKWLARNDNYEGLEVILYDGFEGEQIDEMQPSYYQLDKITGPGSDGVVTLHLTDVLKRADNDRATVPPISNGYLLDAISDTDTELTLFPPGAGDGYPSSGVITIAGRQEIIEYTRTGDVLGLTRGASPSAYAAGDIVQIAEILDSVRLDIFVRRWLVDYVGVPSEWISASEWGAEVTENLPLAVFSAAFYRPTGANELIGEVLRDAGAYLVPNILQKKIELRVLRSLPVSKIISDDGEILLGSFRQTRRPELRLTQLWLFFNQRDVFGSANDPGNFSRWLVTASPGAEFANSQKIKRIYSRFLRLDNLSLIEQTVGRIVERYGAEPVEYEFALDGVDASALGLGQVAVLNHREIVDQHGSRADAVVQVVSRHETERGGKVLYKAQGYDFTFASVLWPDPDPGLPDWADATPEQRALYAYFADDDGLIDGDPAPKLG